MSDNARFSRFEVNRKDFHDARWSDAAVPQAGPGQILLSVDQFAFTANNITYAAYGDVLGYWHFYPVSAEWGVIPVWGFADVLSSEVEGVSPGERLFGYWPMASHAVLTAKSVDKSTIVEGAESRQGLNPFYNRYQRCAEDRGYRADQEGWQSIFRPLCLTAFLLDEYFAEHKFWGADGVLLASASSKTAIGAAHFLSRRGDCRVIGLTSPGNRAFVEALGCYDQVVEYGQLDGIDPDRSSLFVDMAGDATVQMAVHQHFGERLVHSVTVGGTHWTEIRPGLELPGPTPEFFFAPDQIVQRMKEWGSQAFQSRFTEAWLSLMPRVQGSIELVESQGQGAIEDVYRAFLDGSASARKGYLLRP